MFQITKQKRTSYIVFGIYFILLAWLVLFKFATNISELPSMRSINLRPFFYDNETSFHWKEVLYNVIIFVPFGIYVQIFKKDCKIAGKTTVVLLTSLLFEIVQFVFAIGASDITDIIGNTFGGILGVLFCILMRKIAAKKYILIINALGIIIEIAALGILILLLAANR